jgi:nuclear pore complex protein Nup188
VLYQTTNRSPSISEALIKGSILSGFGTSQANREYWESDPDCQRLQTRIRDLLLVIAIESMCVGMVVTPVEQEADMTILRSKAQIDWIHQFVLDQSEDLVPQNPEPQIGSTDFPIWPIPVICLAWSIVLRSLPPNLAPSLSDYDGSRVYQELAMRAFRIPSGLFPWLEEVLSGPLFERAEDVPVDTAAVQLSTFQRKVIKGMVLSSGQF